MPKIKLIKGGKVDNTTDVSDDFIKSKEPYYKLPTKNNPVVEVYKFREFYEEGEEFSADYHFSFQIINFTNVTMLEFCRDVVGIKLCEKTDVPYLKALEMELPRRRTLNDKGIVSDGIGLKEYVNVEVTDEDPPVQKLDVSLMGWVCPSTSVRQQVVDMYKFMCDNGLYGKAEEIAADNFVSIAEDRRTIYVEGDNLTDKSVAVKNITKCRDELYNHLGDITPDGYCIGTDEQGFIKFFNIDDLKQE